jgi:tRNA threonylcarbamoyladenosine biosynthesis protein TsaE
MTISHVEKTTKNPEQTRIFAENIALANLKPGCIISLRGGLGAGKTCFAQGLAWGLGVDRQTYLSSPTFTIVKEYAGRMQVFHIDLYRLKTQSEALDIGIEEYLNADGAVIIEWPDIIEGILRDFKVFTVNIEIISDYERKIRIHTGN